MLRAVGGMMLWMSFRERQRSTARISFGYAAKHGFDALAPLDGDGQHNPSYVPDFIEAIKTGKADIVIGSRFLEKIRRYLNTGLWGRKY